MMIYLVYYTYPDGNATVEKVFKTRNGAQEYINKYAYIPQMYRIEPWPVSE